MPSPAQTTNSTPSVIAEGAKLELLAGGFKFAEGATCDAAGNVFFTDQPNNRIMEWSVEGKLSTFLQPAGRANGMYFDAQGNLLACADEKTELWSITPDGKHTVLAKEFDGKPLNGPNDVWVRPDGGMYLTDPFYDRPWWDYHIRPQDSEQVYFLSADRQPLRDPQLVHHREIDSFALAAVAQGRVVYFHIRFHKNPGVRFPSRQAVDPEHDLYGTAG